jgi:hypothetical protein
VIVPEYPPPSIGAPVRSGTSLVLAVSVIIAGLALAGTGLLPWAGVTAEIGLFDADITRAVRGIDDGTGWLVIGAGLLASLLGLLGLTRHWLFTGFAILPGAFAALSLAMFLSDPQNLAGRLNFSIPGLMDVHPTILYGWFTALAASIAVAVLAAASLIRRR